MNPHIFLKALQGHIVLAKPSQTSLSIAGITTNSNQVKNGFLFIAEKGVSNDGHKYLSAAIENGASALLVERVDLVPITFQGMILQTPNTRIIAPTMAALFYNKPSEKLFCMGVTGTNGKTSFTYLIEHFFNTAHHPTGVIGTIDHHLGIKTWATELTTPHPIEIQARLNDFIQNQAKALAIEVSSHAIDQKRVEGIEFDVGVFTNLTHDHLDYHSTLEEYFEVKQKLFTDILGRSQKQNIFAIINRDDPWGAKMKVHPKVTTWTYGSQTLASGATPVTFSFTLNKMDFTGTQFIAHTPEGSVALQSPLIGIHNIYNVLAAIAAGMAGGLSLKHLQTVLPSFKGIPGRLQRVQNNKGKLVFIDYAHSPDALKNVLLSIRKIQEQVKTPGRIVCVFGCGGDRDKGKRPLMASIAEKNADLIIVTSDNPRTEDPMKIISDIKSGFSNQTSGAWKLEPDRQKAISLAIHEAQPNDIILVAGKGHEDYQIIGKEKFYFSDYEIARKILS